MARYMTDEELYDAGYRDGRGKSVVEKINNMANEVARSEKWQEDQYSNKLAAQDDIVAEINRMVQERQARGGGTPGDTSSGNGSSGNTPSRTRQTEENAYARYLRQAEEAAAAQRAAEQAARRASYDASVGRVNRATDDALRQAYILRMQQEKRLPQQNALLGNGGLSETAATQLQASYGQNRAALEAQRLEQLGNLETQLNSGLAIDEGNYQQKLQQLWQQEALQAAQRGQALAQAADGAAGTKNMPLTGAQRSSAAGTDYRSDGADGQQNGYTGQNTLQQEELPEEIISILEDTAKKYGIYSPEWNKEIKKMEKDGRLNSRNTDAFEQLLQDYTARRQ